MLKKIAFAILASGWLAFSAFAADPLPTAEAVPTAAAAPPAAVTPEVIPVLIDNRSLYMDMGIGGGYYYLYPKDIQVQDFYRGGLTWQGFMEFKAETGLSAKLDVGYYSEGNRSSLAPFGTALTIIPVTASVAYHFFKDSAFSPFVGGGVGIYNINESDPDVTYLRTTAFGTHIYAGGDLYLAPDTILRGELRQTFINPVSNALYYQANFGGLTAMVSLAVEWPIFGPEREMTPQERALARQERLYAAAIQARQARLNEMEFYYQQQYWEPRIYRRWPSRAILFDEINITRQQIDADRSRADQLRNQREQMRQQYIQQKTQLRQQKKESVNPQL